jgi:arginine-tRNA-protein transferase
MTSLSNLKVFATHPHDCSYLDDQQATTLFVDPDTDINVEVYSSLSDMGFRRSGPHVYRPHCASCTACTAVRIPVADFSPNRQQRKTINKNADLTVRQIESIKADEYYNLYEDYIVQRHSDGDMFPPDRAQYESFLLNTIGNTRYIEFRNADQLVAVAVTDYLDRGLSAIYTFFDPSLERRSLGKFAILWQIQHARALELPYLYLGYWIKNCQKMRYKTDYRPLQLLINKQWQTLN